MGFNSGFKGLKHSQPFDTKKDLQMPTYDTELQRTEDKEIHSPAIKNIH